MMRTTLKLLLGAVAIAALSTTAPATAATAGPAAVADTPAAVADQTPLSARVDRQIRALPHSKLRRVCDELEIERFARTRVDGRYVVVASLTCRGATGSSPREISAYRVGGQVVRLGQITPGAPVTRDHGNVSVAPFAFAVDGAEVAVRFGGYTAADAMCCPSRLYRRTDTITATGITHGRLTRTR